MTYVFPAALKAENIPAIPAELIRAAAPYFAQTSLAFGGWCPAGILVRAFVKGIQQVHLLRAPEAPLEQLTAGPEPVAEIIPCQTDTGPGFFFTCATAGNEIWQLFFYAFQSGETSALCLPAGRATGFCWSQSAQKLAYASTAGGTEYQVYIQGLHDLQPQRLTGSGSWFPMDWSPDGQALILQQCHSGTESYPLILDVRTCQLRSLHPETERSSLCFQARWSPDGQGIYYLSTFYSDHLQLIYRQLATGEDQILSADWGIETIALSAGHLAYCQNEGGISRLQVLERATHQPCLLPDLPPGCVTQLAFDSSHNRLALEYTGIRSQRELRVLNLAQASAWELWSQTRVETPVQARLQAPGFSSAWPELKAFTYPSFDQLQIPAFYYPSPADKAPVLIAFHGGPTEQARPQYHKTLHFWQEQLGLAVITPNIRGSSGYGQAYMALDDGYLREESLQDIGALLDWIATQPELDPERVCVYGGSYGGYLVLASLVHYSERLAAGISMMGISHFLTYLKNTAPERLRDRRQEYGDERDPEMRAFLERISPLTQVARIQRPLYLVHGRHDPRVPASEAEQMAAALQAQGQTVWLAIFEDEGHGISKAANGDFFVYSTTLFLQRYLLADTASSVTLK